MLRSRDRSIAVRSSRKNFSSSFDQSLRLVNFSVLLRVELNTSALLSFAIYSKGNRPEKIMFHRKNHCIIYFADRDLISFALSTNDGADNVGSIDRLVADDYLSSWKGNDQFNRHVRVAQSIGERNRSFAIYVSHKKHKLEIIDNQFFGRIRRVVFF